MRNLQATEAKARIAAFLARVKASKAASPLPFPALDPEIPTTIRYQRRAPQEQRV
ncbi:MAG: hypothetical protein AB1421_11010 [Pseudomonadota bacterium]